MKYQGESYEDLSFSLEISKGITLRINNNNKKNSIKQALYILFLHYAAQNFFEVRYHTNTQSRCKNLFEKN